MGYAARFLDELRPWAPAEAVVEQVETLLTMRDQLVRERGAKGRADARPNALHVLRRKAVRTPLAVRIAEDAVAYLGGWIKEMTRRSAGSSRTTRRSGRPSRSWSAFQE